MLKKYLNKLFMGKLFVVLVLGAPSYAHDDLHITGSIMPLMIDQDTRELLEEQLRVFPPFEAQNIK